MASGADCISVLPDEVIHHVMSFLPMQEVVLTSLLSRRWLDLWKSALALRITGVKDCENPEWFIQYVENLLLCRHSGARLDTFILDLDESDFGFEPFLPTYERSVYMWFRIALLCQARVVSLRTTHGLYAYSYDQPVPLLNVPIISQHLSKLDLERVTLRRRSLDFSRCPALVDLKMKDSEIHGNMSSQFLKHLSITCCDFATGSFRARIWMPGLTSLILSDFTGRTPVLGNMPLLVLAVVRVTTGCEDECLKSNYGDCGDHTCSGCYEDGADNRHGESLLLKGLSQVTELELSVVSAVFTVNRDLKLCPTFHMLKTLFLSEWCPGVTADLNVLTCLLQHSPNLEKLALHIAKVPKNRVENERSYKLSEQSFICSHLKTVDIKCEEADERVQKALEILSTYGIPLDQVNIQQTNIASGA